MLVLKFVDFLDVQQWFWDFQKKSKCFELPLDTTKCIGIFNIKDEMIGYFIVQEYDNKDMEIQQGYLLMQYRHLNLAKECTTLLEQLCKKYGCKRMLLGTHNRFKSYLKFAKDLGYTPRHLTFSKEI